MKNSQLYYLSQQDFGEWDAFLDQSPQSTIYGKSWYLAALQCPFEILVFKEKTTILGGIVLSKNSRSKYANPLLCKYLGVYFAPFEGSPYNQESKRRKVLKQLLQELKKRNSFNYFFHPFFNTYLPFYHENFASQVRYSYWIDLKNQTIEAISAKYHSKLRSELKFAQSQSYQINTALNPAIFIDICKKTFTQKGNKFPFSLTWLSNYLLQLKQQNAIQLIGVQNEKGQVLAVAGLLLGHKTNSLILSGLDKAISARAANEFLIDYCIRFSKERADYFDFEGSMIPAIESFYRKFGGDYLPYLNIYKDSLSAYLFNRLRRTYWQMRKGFK